MPAGFENLLEEDVYNGEMGHAAKHNMVNDQVNFLTEQLVITNSDVALLDADITAQVRRTRLADAAVLDREVSTARATVAYDDSRDTQFIEDWSDLAAWNPNTQMQVSGGSLYSNGATGGNAGGNHAVSIGPTETAQFKTTVTFPAADVGQDGGVMIGFAKDAPGAVFDTGGGSTRGLFFNLGASQTYRIDNGVLTSVGGIIQPSTFVVTGTVDEDWYTITAKNLDGSQELRTRWARDHATFPLNNIIAFNADTRQLAGARMGPIGLARGIASITPRAGIEDVGDAVIWSKDGDYGIRVALPPEYDSRIPSPVAMCFHGNSTDETMFADDAAGKYFDQVLLNAGYIVVSAAYNPASSTWGSDNGIAAYGAAYRYVRDHFNIGGIVFLAVSMGSIESLNVLARDAIPGVVAWAGFVPTYDLAECHSNPLFTATINAAYDGNFALNAAGHNPATMPPTAFRSLPSLIVVATDDAAVTPGPNGQQLAADLATVTTVTKVETTGGHGVSPFGFAEAMADHFDTVLGR